MSKLRIGSLFSGVGGLDLAVEEVFEAETIWQVEFNPDAATVLTKRFNPSRRKVEGTVSRTAAMKMIGNGVCTQQAVVALRALLDIHRGEACLFPDLNFTKEARQWQ